MLMTGRNKEDIAQECKEISYREFKSLLAEAIISHLEPIQKRYHELRSDESKLISTLAMGANYADAIAKQTLKNTKIALGYLPKTNPC